jgi:diketogulonate reductase-like aldo/keto reductase
VTRRGPEFDLLPWMAKRQMPLMAYSPVGQGELPSGGSLNSVARKHGASAFQIALAWVLRRGGVIAIPKAGDPAHVRDNAGALAIILDEEDMRMIDRDLPPPTRKRPLEMI